MKWIPVRSLAAFSAIPTNQASFSFSLPLNGDCEVEIVPLNGGSSHTIVLAGQSMTLSLLEEISEARNRL